MQAQISCLLFLSLWFPHFAHAQQSHEPFLTGLRSAVKNPANSLDVYYRVRQPEFTALFKDAANRKDQALLKELLSAMAGEYNQKEPPLGIAVLHRDIEIVKILSDYGSDLNATGMEQRTPLHHVAQDAGCPEILALLLDKGANPNARDFVGTTPLMLAAGASATDNVSALMRAGASVNARANDGETALMRAVQANSPQTVRMLLEAGANPRLKNERGQTAVELILPETTNFLAKQPIGGIILEDQAQQIQQEGNEARKEITRVLEQAQTPTVSALAVSADGKLLVSGDAGGEVQLWDVTANQKIATLTPNERILSLSIASSGKSIAVGCANRPTQIWEKQGSRWKQVRILPVRSAQSLSFFPDNRLLAIGRENGSLELWDTVTQTLKRTLIKPVSPSAAGKTNKTP